MKKLFILPILLSSSLYVADISIKEPLEIQSAVIGNEKINKKHSKKMQTICRKVIGDQHYVNVVTENQSIENTTVNQTLLVDSKTATNSKKTTKRSAKTPSNEQIKKKQFENKKRDVANKINELTSAIESLQDFGLTGEKKKRDFYFSISSGKTHYDNPNAVMNDVSTIIGKIDEILGAGGSDRGFTRVYDAFNPFKDSTIDFQWLGSAALGYHVGGNGKIEFEVINSSIKIKKVSDIKQASLWAIMFNLYYNPNIKNTPVAPYVGFGVGPVNFRFASGLVENININLPWAAYQAKSGISYSFMPELKISLGYRYVNIPVLIVDSVATHNIEAGLILNF